MSVASHVVIVGISNDIDGLREFLSHWTPIDHACLLIVQNVSHCDDLQAHDISTEIQKASIPVAKSGEVLSAGSAFFIPTSKIAEINADKVLEIFAPEDREDDFTVIDSLLISAAKAFQAQSVGVILSGEGNDGGQGLRSIVDLGGLSIVQSLESSNFPAMPTYALAVSTADLVLELHEISPAIDSYLEFTGENGAGALKQIERNLDAICAALKASTNHDFKHYKSSTLIRRIQRRMQVVAVRSVSAYLEMLEDRSEAEALFKELLINVTSFFRDPTALETLKDRVIDSLIRDASPIEKIRVWVAGCSTGEEAYSLAILFLEAIEAQDIKKEVQIIATDIDEHALSIARRGAYPSSISSIVSEERLEKYFQRKAGKYVVRKQLRELCLFSSHNLVNDPPFSQIDLISCRNVLIYLGAHLQQKLIPVFHYALRANGYLFLGNSESITGHGELFKPISAKDRIAQKRSTGIRSLQAQPLQFSSSGMISHPPHMNVREFDIHLIGQRILLDEFAPRYAIISEELDVISLSEGMNVYLIHPVGVFEGKLSRLIRPDLRVAFRSTFREAQKQKRKVQHAGATFRRDEDVLRVRITVQPMPQLGTEDGLYMVVFTDIGGVVESEATSSLPSDKVVDLSVVEQLEKELSDVRGDLDRTVQDLEASNEELKSSNEELLSMNEELQSANEELEASKEEVQAANETLQKTNTDLENLLSSTQIATLFLDEHLIIKNFTPAVSQIYKIRDRDIGRPITDLAHDATYMPPFVIPSSKSNDETSSEIPKEEIFDSEITLNSSKVFLRRILPYKTENDTQDGFVVTFTDVTEIRASEGMFAIITNSVPSLTWVIDQDGYGTYFNKNWLEFTGKTLQESFKVGWLDVLAEEDRIKFLVKLQNAHAQTQDISIDVAMKSWAGEEHWYKISAKPIRLSKDTINRWVVNALNIDNSIQLERDREASDNSNKLKSEFLAHMSHEIRTPLGAIIGFTELLEEELASQPRNSDYLERIQRNARHLSKLIDEILDLSKIEADKMELEKIEFDLKLAIHEVISTLEISAAQKGVYLKEHQLTPIPDRITSDITRFKQVLVNVIGNAIKFTEIGGVDVEVSFEPSSDEGEGLLRIDVKDTGIGITQESAKRLFNAFTQADSSINRKFGGSGLGLSLSAKIMEALGGKLVLLQSDRGQGSTFRIELTLPVTKAKSSNAPFSKTQQEYQRIDGKKVLVVDDAVDNLIIAKRFLARQGAIVETAGDGGEGVKMALAAEYDMIFMDLQMPLVDGYSAIRTLREKGYQGKVVALTAHAMKEEKVKALSSGFDGYLTKPIVREELISAIIRFQGETPKPSGKILSERKED